MGLSLYMCDLIVQEHLYRPLPETVHTIGRPYLGYSYETLLRLLARYGLTPASAAVEYDDFTREAKVAFAATGQRFIADRTFFRALGVKNVVTIDISAYEGAELLLDLTQAIPDELEGTVDFICGGSTLDNVFDPAQYMRNMARLLRPGGRLVEINEVADFNRPYVMLPAPWYFDYFLCNAFDDCKIYVHLYADKLHYYVVDCADPALAQDGLVFLDNFDAGEHLITVALMAEKGEASTWNRNPVQDGFRSHEDHFRYRDNLARIKSAPRPVLTGFGNALSAVPRQRRAHAHYRYLGTFDFAYYDMPDRVPGSEKR